MKQSPSRPHPFWWYCTLLAGVTTGLGSFTGCAFFELCTEGRDCPSPGSGGSVMVSDASGGQAALDGTGAEANEGGGGVPSGGGGLGDGSGGSTGGSTGGLSASEVLVQEVRITTKPRYVEIINVSSAPIATASIGVTAHTQSIASGPLCTNQSPIEPGQVLVFAAEGSDCTLSLGPCQACGFSLVEGTPSSTIYLTNTDGSLIESILYPNTDAPGIPSGSNAWGRITPSTNASFGPVEATMGE